MDSSTPFDRFAFDAFVRPTLFQIREDVWGSRELSAMHRIVQIESRGWVGILLSNSLMTLDMGNDYGRTHVRKFQV